MPKWSVRLHLMIDAASAKEAREIAVALGEELGVGDPPLTHCLVDNEEEVELVTA